MQFVFKLQIYFLISDHDLKYFAIICGEYVVLFQPTFQLIQYLN